MARASRDFQVFAKPIGSLCNLACSYCYYLEKGKLYLAGEQRMSEALLEDYITQHIDASSGPEVRFSWHGGEPTLLGLDYFRAIVALQRRHRPPGWRIVNGIQTNATLLDEDWCRFLADEDFAVGVSLDGPQPMHDRYRVTRHGGPTHERAMRGYALLQEHGVNCDILCVVNEHNVQHPSSVYRFFKQIGARYLTFLPLVERRPGTEGGVSRRSVPAADWGEFLCSIFDEWVSHDVGRVEVQLFEEVARTALGQEHALCIFRETCGDIPVIERNGDLYSCDHFVDREHRLGNIRERRSLELLESPAQRAFGRAKRDRLPDYCRACDVREMCNGECPRNRFVHTPDGQPGLNYLCEGYKRFFAACRPFVAALRLAHTSAGEAPQTVTTPNPPRGGTRRNDPCPCGSGRKYKHCCLGR